MNLAAVKRGYLDFDLAKIECFILSNGAHVISLKETVKAITDIKSYEPEFSYEIGEEEIAVILGSDFIDLCKSYLKSEPKGTREYNVAEMFVNLTKYVSIDAIIHQACLPDSERVKVNFDDAISSLLNPPKIKK